MPHGFALLWLLFWLAGLGVGLAALGTVWQTAAQREREAELLFVGDQYRRALESFHRASPAGQARYPAHLEELLLDPRFPHTVRHLRRPYPDPITGSGDWGLLRAAGGIVGVYSRAAGEPRKRAGFAEPYRHFAEASQYRDWQFRAQAGGAAAAAAQTEDAQGGQALTEAAQTEAGSPHAAPAPPPSAPPARLSPQQRLAQVMACEGVRQTEFRRCADTYHPHDPDGWRTCTDAVTARYTACLRAR